MSDSEEYPVALPPEQEDVAQAEEAIAQAEVAEALAEIAAVEETGPRKPSPAEVAAERAGIAARGLLGGIGQHLESPGPPSDDLSDLFEGPQEEDNDVYTRDLLEVDAEDVIGDGPEDMSDLLEVTDEDIMGAPDEPDPQKDLSKYRRTGRTYAPQPGVGGMRWPTR